MKKKIEPPFKPSLNKIHFDPEYTGGENIKKNERSYSCGCNASSSQDNSSEMDVNDSKYDEFYFEREKIAKKKTLTGVSEEINDLMNSVKKFGKENDIEPDKHTNILDTKGNQLTINTVSSVNQFESLSKSIVNSPVKCLINSPIHKRGINNVMTHTPSHMPEDRHKIIIGANKERAQGFFLKMKPNILTKKNKIIKQPNRIIQKKRMIKSSGLSSKRSSQDDSMTISLADKNNPICLAVSSQTPKYPGSPSLLLTSRQKSHIKIPDKKHLKVNESHKKLATKLINSPKRLRLKSKGNKNKTMENIEKKMYTQRTSREKFPAERFTKNSVENITSEHVKISSIFSKVFKSNASKPIGKFSNEYFKEEQKGTKERILSGKKINRENSSNSYKGNIFGKKIGRAHV